MFLPDKFVALTSLFSVLVKMRILSCVTFINLNMLSTKKYLDDCFSSLQCAFSLGNWNSLSRSSRNLGAI